MPILFLILSSSKLEDTSAGCGWIDGEWDKYQHMHAGFNIITSLGGNFGTNFVITANRQVEHKLHLAAI